MNVASKYDVPIIKKNQPDDSYKFLPLPDATGNYPYHLIFKDICPENNDQQLIFHMLGDTGSVRSTGGLRKVAAMMAAQYKEHIAEDRPQFLYHLGDVVYNYGEAEHYDSQFFKPFKDYPCPILAIAGNHDSDVNPASAVPYQSLDAFTTVFCDTVARNIVFDGGAERKSMVQPHVYWTLKTPLATIIGLHSNVPKYGAISDEQRDWFIEELKAADLERPGKALIICLHHAPYSADINHGSSVPMIEFLEGVFIQTGIRPDVVFSGHVHNYQRFSKVYADGIMVPYIVAGAGGYDELHTVALTDDNQFTPESPLFKGVKLEHYCDNKHGFLKIAIKKSVSGLTLTIEYYTLRHEETIKQELAAELEDSLVLTF